jgi:hypothetical protein
MTNSRNLEKSKGVVMFAVNTDTVDYIKIANQAARLVERHLQLPVTLITDNDADASGYNYDKVIRIDPQGHTYRTEDMNVQWRNFGRYLAYNLTPYDETTLIDSDYMVMDNSLLKLWSTDFDYKLMHHNSDEVGASYEMMGVTSLPFIWATVILFRKAERTEALFQLVGKVQRNYNYYRLLYNIREGNYRNDYAFAIANIIINGYAINEQQGIPWRMFTLTKKVDRLELVDGLVRVYFKEGKPIVVSKQNIHIMDKEYLQTRGFDVFVGDVCAA